MKIHDRIVMYIAILLGTVLGGLLGRSGARDRAISSGIIERGDRRYSVVLIEEKKWVERKEPGHEDCN